MLKTAFFNKKDAISRLRPRDTKKMLTLGSHPWSGFGHLLKGAYLSYVTVSKGPKAPKDAKQSKILASSASVLCQNPFIH